MTDRSRTARKRNTKSDRQVGELDAVGLEVVEQPDADDGEPRRREPDARRAGAVLSRMLRTTGARSSSEPGPVRKMMLNAGRRPG